MSFAAGTLLATAFFDLMPEAAEETAISTVLLWTLLGILLFFLLERFIHWFHHHHEHLLVGTGEQKQTVPLIIFGDSVHNFIDGAAIAAAFLVSFPLGVTTALAVAMHEIPQEISDFAILLHRGLKKEKVLLFNLLSALTAFAGAILTFFIAQTIQGLLPVLLSLTAGFFIYIAASDLIPEIHQERRKGFAFFESVLLLLGVVVVWVFVSILG